MNSIPNTTAPLSRALVFFLLICGLTASTAIFWSSSRYGLGLSPDSAGYIAAARNLMAGHGVIIADGSPLILQPPLYPTTVAAVSILSGMDPLAAARFLNAALLCCIIWITGGMVIRLSRHPALGTLGILAVFFSTPLHDVSLMAWSEPLFIFFSLLGIVFLSGYLRHPRPLSLILFTATMAAICLTRYIGVVFIAVGCLGIVALGRSGMRQRLRDAAFSLVSAVPLALWLMRNEIVSGTLLGPRAPSQRGLFENVILTAEGILAEYLKGHLSTEDMAMIPHHGSTLTWYLKEHLSTGLLFTSGSFSFILLAVCAICFFGVWLIVAARLLGLFSFFDNGKGVFLARKIPQETYVSCFFAAAYLTLLIITSTTTGYNKIGSRLLSPIFAPMQVILFSLISWKTNFTGTAWNIRLWRILLLTALIGCLIGPIRSTLAVHRQTWDHGRGYSDEAWRESETIRALSHNQAVADGTVLCSNAADAIYLRLGRAARQSPARTIYNPRQKTLTPQTLDELRGNWPAENKVILVWFDRAERDYLFTPNELRLVANVLEISRLADGTIYSVNKMLPSP